MSLFNPEDPFEIDLISITERAAVFNVEIKRINAKMDNAIMSYKDFVTYIEAILAISNSTSDYWKLNVVNDNKFLTKKQSVLLENPEDINERLIATFEYHVVYNISYAVPVLCFDVWNQNGSRISLEDYWKYNKHLRDFNMHDTLTQTDHPALNRPIFAFHPCKTHEILKGFARTSKNPIVSWLSVVRHFVHLELLETYIKNC
ncbi:unnamed protein product [Phyllotreta striolata]|uniref:Ubiquitin-like-conjugating enzyme ATG10 n=1 Tax=Phyllotreta striolata TaxID=444603 RepID=A0A9N9XNU3_PHYSR|nr:unnamed protein product [Phyllotreta striolata]